MKIHFSPEYYIPTLCEDCLGIELKVTLAPALALEIARPRPP